MEEQGCFETTKMDVFVASGMALGMFTVLVLKDEETSQQVLDG